MKQNQSSVQGQNPVPIEGHKQLYFFGLMMLIPVLFFVVLEGALRWVGYGDTYPLFIDLEERPSFRYQNPEVARRYFSREAQVPNSTVDYFRAVKQPEGFRIFVQGGSTAAGYPFYHGAMFSRMLEQRLQQTFPDREIEVVNTAMSAVNSYTLVDLSDEILAEAPDAVLIYAGHNEYYGALGVASAESLGRVRSMVRLYLKLRELRIVQALRNILVTLRTQFGDETGRVGDQTLMERIVGEQVVAFDSPLYRQGVEQFRQNLETLLARYAEQNVPVFIGTPASNLKDHKPFMSKTVEGTDVQVWKNLYRKALGATAARDTLTARVAFDSLFALDPGVADVHFAYGRLLESQGRIDEARAAYVQAKERDQLRFRAPEAFNDIIREAADRYGAVVVETQQALMDASPSGIIGSRVMLEHLHPTLEGYFIIADAFYKALQANGVIESNWDQAVPTEQARAERLHTEVDSLVGMYRVRRLMGSWPFKPVGTVDLSLDSLKANSEVEEIALDLYREEIDWQQATEALRRYCESRQEYHKALRVALAVVQAFPVWERAYVNAGNALSNLQRYRQALVYYRAANDLKETPEANRMIGALLLNQNDFKGALPYLEKAVRADPSDEVSLYNLAGAYALDGRREEALETINRLLDLNPNHEAARRLAASIR